MPNADEIRDAQRSAWAGLAPGWDRWDAIIMEQLAPVTAAMVEQLGIVDGQHHLDVASGTGEPGLTIAALAPQGRVVLTDLTAEMLDVARRRATSKGITNVETRVCSADDLPFDDATFDTVSVRFGYMFFPDLARVTAEIARVLRPGGRVSASVWIDPAANPWTSIVVEAITREAQLAPPAPDAPGMYRCAAPNAVGALFAAHALVDVVEREVDVALVTRDAEEYWDMISEHVSLAVAALQKVDEVARARIRTDVIARVQSFAQDGIISVPGRARCTGATRPT